MYDYNNNFAHKEIKMSTFYIFYIFTVDLWRRG